PDDLEPGNGAFGFVPCSARRHPDSAGREQGEQPQRRTHGPEGPVEAVHDSTLAGRGCVGVARLAAADSFWASAKSYYPTAPIALTIGARGSGLAAEVVTA